MLGWMALGIRHAGRVHQLYPEHQATTTDIPQLREVALQDQQVLAQALAHSRWLVGDRFTAADLLLASTLKIAFDAHLLPHEGVLGDYVARAEDRDAFRRAVAIEQREAARLLHA